MKTLFCILLLVFAVYARKYIEKSVPPFSEEMIRRINAMNSTWKAGHNFANGTTVGDIRSRSGVAADSHKNKRPPKVQIVRDDLPEFYDARQSYPECPNIGRIEDQGNCGSCWAFSAAAVMSDRLCIATQGMTDIRLSVMDLLGCCKGCQHNCIAGYPNMAWDFYVNEGVVTGGPYHSNEGCKPYLYYSCKHYHISGPEPTCIDFHQNPACNRTCQTIYNRKYSADKHYGRETYNVDSNEKAMRSELYNNGPIQVTLHLYADFIHYKTGVYQQLSKYHLTKHAVRIIGWGQDKGVPYWLVVNSYNINFGENGLFRIIRGTNECGIESEVTAGLPKLKRKRKQTKRGQSSWRNP